MKILCAKITKIRANSIKRLKNLLCVKLNPRQNFSTSGISFLNHSIASLKESINFQEKVFFYKNKLIIHVKERKQMWLNSTLAHHDSCPIKKLELDFENSNEKIDISRGGFRKFFKVSQNPYCYTVIVLYLPFSQNPYCYTTLYLPLERKRMLLIVLLCYCLAFVADLEHTISGTFLVTLKTN